MHILSKIIGLLLVVLLTACGGGGGSPGTTNGDTVGGTTATASITLSLADTVGALSANSVIFGIGARNYFAKALVKDKTGAVVANQLVSFAVSNGIATLVPAAALTNSAGIASIQIVGTTAGAGVLKADSQVGDVAATASIGLQTTAGTLAQPSNLLFTSVSAPLMVVTSATSGNKQSIVKFQVVSELGAGVSGQQVIFQLDPQTLAGGVTFLGGGVSTSADQTVLSDSSGFAQIAVGSGALPTPVLVTAFLSANMAIRATSSGISVTNGKTSQSFTSISATKLNIEGFIVDGVSTNVTMRIADRLANPVSVGTVINFVASAGLVTGSCVTDASSGCTVPFSTQGTRPPNGRVTVLAYLDGEESFTDLNGNNVFDTGEPLLADLGQAYLDKNANGIYDSGVDQIIPGGLTGSAACLGAGAASSVPNTCDGTWSSSVRVRQSIVIVLSTRNAAISQVTAKTANSFSVQVADANGNSMAVGTTVAAAVTTVGSACAVTSVSPLNVGTTTLPTSHVIALNGDISCVAANIQVTVTSAPSNQVSIGNF